MREYEKSQGRATEYIFATINSDKLIHDRIDLHGMHVKEAQKIVQQRLIHTEEEVKKASFHPNMGNGVDHVFKIICGAGHHSQGRKGVLKYKINDMLA